MEKNNLEKILMEEETTQPNLFSRIRKGFGKYVVAALALTTIGLNSCGSTGGVDYGNHNSSSNSIQDVMQDNNETDTEPDVYMTITCLGSKDWDEFGMKHDQLLVSGFNPVCPILDYPYVNNPIEDCDDNDPNNYPGGIEVCDMQDNNCNGQVDEGLENCCYVIGEIKDYIGCPIGCLGPYDIIFVIDNSGSMGDSDPYDIRYTGLEEFIEKMGKKIRGLFVPFADNATKIGYFTSDKELLLENMDDASTYGFNGGTDIGLALNYAINQFENNGKSRIIALFTDGGSSYIPEDIKSKAEQNNITIYAFGLGNGVDSYILQQTVTDDAQYFFISSAADIPAVYDKLFKMLETYECWTECTPEHKWESKCIPCCQE